MAFPLTNKEQVNYLAWLLRNGVTETPDYDMKGFYKQAQLGDPRVSSEVNPNDGKVHFTDMFKLPNHETFSTDSKFANALAGQWNGGELPNGGESWANYGPSGLIVSEAPWNSHGIRRNSLAGLLDLFGPEGK